ncbi:hypothetical protein HJC23_002260 [Cyclotella cryptica]|uniref:SET domain-containing protein n=1 Tax=Cyclotella cryptica TaxID=29204 RepID=A0ABD3QG76_9STRA|eukprot:CCRYP_005713-RA/>CCRYP_005713-RA protein AED:0.03 eAED:0.03 QI:0/0/0/1/1/1/2/0/517
MRPETLIQLLGLASTLSAATAFTSIDPLVARRPRTHSCPALQSTTNPLAINVNEIAERDIESFERWSNEVGIQKAPGFVLKSADRYSKNVYAMTVQDVASGSPVLYVPEELIFSSNKAMAAYRTPEMAAAERQLETFDSVSELRQYYLMVQLLVEIERGTDSPWYPWLNSLPRYFENAVSMSSFCVNCLPPLMRKLNEKERGNQQSLNEWAFSKVPYLSDETKANEALIKWVYQIVYTRSFEWEGDLRIVPMGDMFDHTSNGSPEVMPWYDEYGNYYAYSQFDIPAGSPLRMTYGHETRPSFLLARYGFLDEEGQATHCKLIFENVDDDLVELGYSEERMLFYSTGEVSEEVWDVLLYRFLDQTNNVMEKQTLMNAFRNEDYDTKNMLHETYYPYTSAMLMEHIDNFLVELDKLQKKAETIGKVEVYVKNEHPRLPLIMRHNEFIKDAFLKVKSMYSPDENWRDATMRVTVLECNIDECAEAECVVDEMGNWECEGGLGYNEDGTERATSKTIMQYE